MIIILLRKIFVIAYIKGDLKERGAKRWGRGVFLEWKAGKDGGGKRGTFFFCLFGR